MSRRDGACWRHPAYRSAGVCPECLTERLYALAPSPDSYIPRRFSNGAELGYVLVDQNRKNFGSSTSQIACNNVPLASGKTGEPPYAKNNPLVSPLVSEAYLKRSKSWSHWEGIGNPGRSQSNQVNTNGFYAGRKSDAVLDDWTRQRFFSIFAKDQWQQSKRNEAGGASSRTPQRLGSGLHNSGSGNERRWQGTPKLDGCSTSRLDGSKLDGRRELNTCTSTILENGSLEEGLDTGAATAKKSPRKSSAWWSSLLQRAFRKPKAKGTDETEPGNRRTPARSSGYFNKTSSRKEDGGKTSWKKAKSKSVSTSEYMNSKQQTENRGHTVNRSNTNNTNTNTNNNLSWISSPLRLFKQPKQQRRASEQQTTQQQQQRHSCYEERSSWSIPSTAELKRHHPTTPAYTAYYRDYGAWSLSSSPVPNNRWSNSNRGKQPWENRDVAHSSSSPYHAVGASTWNFYLTPLRPVKATSSGSKHRY